MGEFILNIMEQYGYIGIAFLIALENVFPPIPSEVILTFGGFLTTWSNLSFLGVLISSTIGSMIGAFILYYLGYFAKDFLLNIFKSEDIASSMVWFNKQGYKAVFLCRFVPIIRSLVSIPAGISKMNVPLFFFYTILGTLIWNAVLIYAGVFLGENWSIFSSIISRYSKVVLFIIILLITTRWGIKKARIYRRKKGTNSKKNVEI